MADTLKPNRETVTLRDGLGFRWGEPIGTIEDWAGEVVVEVTERCVLSEPVQDAIAKALADERLPIEVEVPMDAWDLKRMGNRIHLTPREWSEAAEIGGGRE